MNVFVLYFQIDGGTNISIKLRWSQQLSYNEGQFSLTVPFSFPEYVTPAIKKISKKEKIQLNVNSGIATEILCKATSHPLKVHILIKDHYAFVLIFFWLIINDIIYFLVYSIYCSFYPQILQVITRHAGKFGFLYEAEILTWSNTDFSFSYSVRIRFNLLSCYLFFRTTE